MIEGRDLCPWVLRLLTYCLWELRTYLSSTPRFEREIIKRLVAASATGVSPSRGSHATAPIACDGSMLTKHGLPPTVAGREYHCPL